MTKSTRIKLPKFLVPVVPVVALLLGPIIAVADSGVLVNPRAAVEFARLPSDLCFPEGIAANPANGDIYVATFAPGATNSLLRYHRSGRLVARTDFSGITPILGLAYNPHDHKVYLASVGDFTGSGSKIQRIPADFNAGTPVETIAAIPGLGAPPPRNAPNPDGTQDVITFGNAARVPNALVFSQDGDLYISDSFQGAVFRIDNAHACSACVVHAVAHDGMLATAGFPPFGANGVALNSDETALFVANTGDDRILRIDLASGAIEVFAESVNGADGIAFDGAGILWVCANQADHVVGLDATGRAVAQLGAFHGIRRDGAPRGLSFPASLVIVHGEIFVTNAALPLRGALDPESEVTTYTVARIKIPPSLH